MTGYIDLCISTLLSLIRVSLWTCTMEWSAGCLLWSAGGGRAQP